VTHHHPPPTHIFRHGCTAGGEKKLAKYVAVLFCRKFILALKSGEFLPIYKAVKHFQHTIQSRHFLILTDHMPIIFAFQQKKDKFSSRHFDQLDDLFLFTTEIRYVFGQDNVVADAFPRIKAIAAQVNHDGIAASQVGEDEVQTLLVWNTTPLLEKVSRRLPAILQQICRKFSVVCTSTSTKAGIRFLAQSVSSRETSERLNSLPSVS
jgi:hypothetical protein